MVKKLLLEITVGSELEADIDLEIIREFKDLMEKIKKGDSRGRTFVQMMNGGPNGEGKFTISEIKDRGLQINA